MLTITESAHIMILPNLYKHNQMLALERPLNVKYLKLLCLHIETPFYLPFDPSCLNLDL